MNESNPLTVEAQQSSELSRLEQGLKIQDTSMEEFLPPIRPWVQFAGIFLVGSFFTVISLMSIWPYRVIVKAKGELRPEGKTNVVDAPVTGTLRNVLVKENQLVTAGQIIATLDSSELQGQEKSLVENNIKLTEQTLALLNESKAAYASSVVEVQKAQQKLSLAEAEFNRYKLLSSTGAASQSQYDEKQANYEIAQSNLELARKKVLEQQAASEKIQAQLQREVITNQSELNQTTRDLKNLEIKAPVTGIIYDLNIRNSKQVIQVGEEIARIAPSSTGLVAQVLVPSEQIDDLKLQLSADLRLSGCPYPDFGTMKAVVSSIAPDTATNNRANNMNGQSSLGGGYKIGLRPKGLVMESGERRCQLRQGMTLEADIITRKETALQFFMRKARFISGH